MNTIKRTNHFLLSEEKPRRSANTPELASLIVAGLAVVAVGVMLL